MWWYHHDAQNSILVLRRHVCPHSIQQEKNSNIACEKHMQMIASIIRMRLIQKAMLSHLSFTCDSSWMQCYRIYHSHVTHPECNVIASIIRMWLILNAMLSHLSFACDSSWMQCYRIYHSHVTHPECNVIASIIRMWLILNAMLSHLSFACDSSWMQCYRIYHSHVTHPECNVFASIICMWLILNAMLSHLSFTCDSSWMQCYRIYHSHVTHPECNVIDSGVDSIWINTLRPKFSQNFFKFIFFNENCRILHQISLNCVPKGPIDNTPTLGQIIPLWHKKIIFAEHFVRWNMKFVWCECQLIGDFKNIIFKLITQHSSLGNCC